eukprot:scaffold87705_cov22-Tisochrysis_lutea.AAC.1
MPLRNVLYFARFLLQVHVSYLEIYNEQLYDLLAENPGDSNGMAVQEDPTRGAYVSCMGGSSMNPACSASRSGLRYYLDPVGHTEVTFIVQGAVASTGGIICVAKFPPSSASMNYKSVDQAVFQGPLHYLLALLLPLLQVRGLTLVEVKSEEEALAQYFLGEQVSPDSVLLCPLEAFHVSPHGFMS